MDRLYGKYSPEKLVGATAAAALGEETVRRLAHAGHAIAHVARNFTHSGAPGGC